jgi:hypothetical protein
MRLAERTLTVVAALWCLAACTEVPHGGVAKAPEAPLGGTPDATELLPGDLDLVVRVDLSKIRAGLGRDSARELVDRAIEDAGASGAVARALGAADVVWLGIRVADFEHGDRVMVVRSGKAAREPDKPNWTRYQDVVRGVVRYDARVAPARSGTEHIFRVGKRDTVFVSPVEALSVERVLTRGPDAERGEPEERGLISLDYRARKLSPEMQDRFPSLAAIVAGIERLRAQLDLSGGDLALEARIRCKNARAAQRLMRFVSTIRDAAQGSARDDGAKGRRPGRFAELLAALHLERSGSTVALRWPLPREVVAAWIHDSAADAAPTREPAPAPVLRDDAPPPAPDAEAPPTEAPRVEP